jgi:hypothetical protein
VPLLLVIPNVKVFEFETAGADVLIVPAVPIIWLGIDVSNKAPPAT